MQIIDTALPLFEFLRAVVGKSGERFRLQSRSILHVFRIKNSIRSAKSSPPPPPPPLENFTSRIRLIKGRGKGEKNEGISQIGRREEEESASLCLEYRRRGEERKREGKGRREGEKEFSPSPSGKTNFLTRVLFLSGESFRLVAAASKLQRSRSFVTQHTGISQFQRRTRGLCE